MISMRFLIDMNLGREFTYLMQKAGHDAIFARDIFPLVTDEEILAKAASEGRIIITNDKDFGELVFLHGKTAKGVILLRTALTDAAARFELVKDALDKAAGKFIVVKDGKMRIRSLK